MSHANVLALITKLTKELSSALEIARSESGNKPGQASQVTSSMIWDGVLKLRNALVTFHSLITSSLSNILKFSIVAACSFAATCPFARIYSDSRCWYQGTYPVPWTHHAFPKGTSPSRHWAHSIFLFPPSRRTGESVTCVMHHVFEVITTLPL